ncbi:MAG: hypothetical protein HY942_08835 [Gammaproteobacteria bacterium]|nr:hypothetical protein [Gammaproteobacteria bacterium]
MKRITAWTVLWLSTAASAQPWEFSPPLPVTAVHGAGIYHHLDSSGRKNIAASGETVAIAWADNRSGSSQVYFTFKSKADSSFAREQRVSDGKNAYEPVIAALANGRFAIGWEQDGQVWMRPVQAGTLGRAQLLADDGSQINMALNVRGQGYAVWVQRVGRLNRAMLARFEISAEQVARVHAAQPVDAQPPAADQFYPGVTLTEAGVMVVWEDRRHGHSVLYYSHSADGRRFSAPKRLNERGPSRSGGGYGKGTGVARAALAAHGKNAVTAVWLDKRDFEGGYDVYGAVSHDGGRSFGKNQKIQDQFGDIYGQWHAAIAGHASGLRAAVWDDDRDDTADVWLAWPVQNGWSENLAVPGASGLGEQTQPSVALDAAGDLHLAWIERDAPDAPTRLRYLHAKRSTPDAPTVQDK